MSRKFYVKRVISYNERKFKARGEASKNSRTRGTPIRPERAPLILVFTTEASYLRQYVIVHREFAVSRIPAGRHGTTPCNGGRKKVKEFKGEKV
jgi:hypothetical protein